MVQSRRKLTVTGPGTKVLPAMNMICQFHQLQFLTPSIPSPLILEKGSRVSNVIQCVIDGRGLTRPSIDRYNGPVGPVSPNRVLEDLYAREHTSTRPKSMVYTAVMSGRVIC